MTAQQLRPRTPRRVLIVSTVALGVGFLFGPVAGTANAQSNNCAIEQFIGADNSIDLTAYAACVAGENQGQAAAAALPRTGSDVGQYVGIGTGLVGLGAAFVYGSRRRQRTNS